MISIVNGFVCTCSCDVSKAKKGEDPSRPPGLLPGEDDPNKIKREDPAVLLGGVLKINAAADAAAPRAAQIRLLDLVI